MEFCVQVTGTVQLRPEGNANPNLLSGGVGVAVTELEVPSDAATTAGMTYQYSVVAMDTAGNASIGSSHVEVMMPPLPA